MIGSIIGFYKLIEEIGHGGFGEVYLALDTRTNATVAVKVLKAELVARPDFRARFEQEAQTLKLLPADSHIVGLRDFGWDQDRPYLVMDYLAGHDLSKFLDDGPLSVKRAVSIAAQTAGALEIAARRGLIHCDIKPENLRIMPDDVVKVMDFGIARVVDVAFRETAGTPAYMAPELWQGEPPSPAVDVYALGCVLDEMLIGQPPFVSSIEDDRRQARREVAQLHQTAEPDWSLLQREPSLAELLSVLKEMLAKSPHERPSAGQVAEQLRRIELTLLLDIHLIAEAVVLDREVTRPHAIDEVADEGTIVRPPPALPTPSDQATPTPTGRDERIATGAHISAQRHLGSIDLGVEVCRAALIHDGWLFTGTLDQQVCRIDLRNGRLERWNVLPRGTTRKHNWAFAACRDRLVLHTGGAEWLEINPASGQLVRQGRWPEPGLRLIVSGEWLYLAGATQRLYRAPLRLPDRLDTFEVGARLTGVPSVTHGAAFVPTALGVVHLDTGSRHTTIIGPQQMASSITRMHNHRLVALYPSVGDDGRQRSGLRLFDVSPSPATLLAEIEVDGQSAGPAQAMNERIILTGRNGHVKSWDAVEYNDGWKLEPAWERIVEPGRGIQSDAALNGGLLALAPCKDNSGVLIVLNAATGQPVFEQPVAGDVFVSPRWWERTLSIVVASGSIEMFRIAVG